MMERKTMLKIDASRRLNFPNIQIILNSVNINGLVRLSRLVLYIISMFICIAYYIFLRIPVRRDFDRTFLYFLYVEVTISNLGRNSNNALSNKKRALFFTIFFPGKTSAKLKVKQTSAKLFRIVKKNEKKIKVDKVFFFLFQNHPT